MPRILLPILLLTWLGTVQVTNAQDGQLIVDGEPIVIDFDGFTGAGFAPDPAPGQLDSYIFTVQGLSEGDVGYGDTRTAGDFARGPAAGGVTSGGIYAGNPSDDEAPWLFAQPTSSDFAPGTFTVRYENASGQTITAIDLSYQVKVFNDQGRSSSWNLSVSTNNESYARIPALDYASPAAADATPVWQSAGRSTTITDLNIADGGFFYVRFTSADVGGSGSRDQIGVDNITLTAALEPSGATVRFAEDAATVTEGGMYSLVVELVDANNDFVVVSVETMCLDDDVTPTSTTRQLSDSNPTATVRLTATQDMTEEDTEQCAYDLTIVDVDGNVTLGSPSTFVLTIEDDDQAPFVDNRLLISEFMADPVGSDSDANGEYIELFNNTTRPIGLDGYTISDASGNSDTIDGVTIQPGGFVVLCFNSNVNANGGIASCDYDYSGVTLNNGSDDIVLQDPAGSIVDIVRYTSSWIAPGVSTVYVGSPSGDNSVLGNWAESISREGRYNDDTVLGDDGSPGTNGVHGNLVSPFGVDISAYCYTQASGDWSDSATWTNCSEGVPGVGDAAAVLAEFTVSVTEPVEVNVVVVEAGPQPGFAPDGGPDAARSGEFDGFLIVETAFAAEVMTVAGDAVVTGEGAVSIGTDLSVLGSLMTNDAVTLRATENGPAHYTEELFGSIEGRLTAERRYVDDAGGKGAGSFRGIFPPLKGVTFAQLNDDFQTQGGIGSDFPDAQPNLYRFDAPSQHFLAITDYTSEFDPDSGYVFYMFDFDIPSTWDVTGTLRDEYSLDLHYNDDGDGSNDFNWVPQPFPGPIDFRELYRNSTFFPDSINATLYVLDPVTEEFRIYNALTGTGTEPGSRGAGRYVAAFQSFVVRTNAPGTTLNYTYDIMDTGESVLLVGRGDFGGEDEVSPHVRLELAGEGSAEGLGSTQTYLVFYPDGEEGYDPADAAMLFPFSADYATLVLMDAAGQDLAMDARGLALTTETFNARVATTQPGTYTLTWPTIHEVPAGWSLTLLDTDTGNEVNLRDQSSYTFEVGGPTAARRSTALSTLLPAQSNTSARFVISVSATTTAGEDTGTAPGEFALDGAYPNPFATTATIRYALPHASDVRLTVYDVLGREVVTLFEGAREAGRYAATVSGLGLSGGVYFVRMTADGFAETKKFVVLN